MGDMVDTVDMVDTAVDTDVEVMVDTDTPVDMEVMVDTDMVDTVAREKPKLPQKLMPKPGTVTSVTDTVPDTVFLDTDLDTDVAMPVMEVTVLDTAMVDTVARDPLMPGTDVVMEVMVDTPVDTVMVDTAVDMAVMVDTDTESKYFLLTSPKKSFYTKLCHLYHCRNE